MQSNVVEKTVEKRVVCSSCDGFCPVSAKVVDGRVVKVAARKDPYGPEAFAVATSNWNTTVDSGLSRRFMNLLGSPNWISGVAYCMGNTAAVNRMVYGWYPGGDVLHSKCIVLFGHNPRRHSWTAEFKAIRVAQAKGAKLIVLDPRKSENAEVADIWLPLRAGTDAAMCFGWLNVILDEGLYDREFVAQWTTGFDAFVARVREYPVERVAQITGVEPESIAAAARMYATAESACIPWSPITDQQTSSTSAIRLHCALRALTGNLDVQGGERFIPFNPNIVSDTDLELHELLAPEQRAKQLGADEFPVFTYRGMEALREPLKKTWGREWANLVSGCYMANPTSTFRAMAEGTPYPVKPFFALGNNTLMAFANTRQIYKALMNQDLLVAHEHMMTLTAQISDFWRELAHRMGFGEQFPWESLVELYDHRLSPGGKTWNEVVADGVIPMMPFGEKKYVEHGFATPSGKVELYSSVLEDLGFDPLPYYREAAEPDEKWPLSMFIGVRDDQYFQTGQRHVPELRRRAPEPTAYLHPADAEAYGLRHGDWAWVETTKARVAMRADVRDQMPKGLVRVPHGWWKPESAQGLERLSGMWAFSDAQLSDDEDMSLMDLEQGVPHLKGVPCRVAKLTAAELADLEARFGKSSELPPGPRPRVHARTEERDFMYDPEIGDGVEWEAIELALYGKGSLN